MQHPVDPRTRKYVKGYGFLSFARCKWGDAGADALKTASKKSSP